MSAAARYGCFYIDVSYSSWRYVCLRQATTDYQCRPGPSRVIQDEACTMPHKRGGERLDTDLVRQAEDETILSVVAEITIGWLSARRST